VHVDNEFNSRVYNGQFSDSGDFFYCSSQDEIKLYDCSGGVEDMNCINVFNARSISWTITDLDMSRDQNYIIYSSVCPLLNIIKVGKDPLQQFSGMNDQKTILLNSNDDGYGVFSCQFSYDSSELLLGTRINTIEIFDFASQKISYRAENAHNDDINTICYASDGSPVIYSGSDDSSIKVWDKRITPIKPAGVLVGHREGITCVTSKNDEIHLVSNGKDQVMKYWDIRKMSTLQRYVDFRETHKYSMRFNYMSRHYPLSDYNKKLSEDCSVITFKGHQVLTTLIRCYFSPLASTGQRFVYTGSADGMVYIYDTYTGKLVNILGAEDSEDEDGTEAVCRDVSWHPYLPYLSATSFDEKVNYYAA